MNPQQARRFARYTISFCSRSYLLIRMLAHLQQRQDTAICHVSTYHLGPGAAGRGGGGGGAPSTTFAANWARTWARAGKPKARVLPLPVAAMPTRSAPLQAGAQHSVWMGLGVAKAAHDFSSSGPNPVRGKPP